MNSSSHRFGFLALAGLLTSLLLAPSPALASGKPIVVLPPGSNPYGKSYQEWSDSWWRWAYSVPAPVNPLFDETGENAGQNQTGQVYFLAGVFNVSGTAERTITVPKGKALFFPILNTEWDNLCPPLDPQPAPGDLVSVLKTNVTSFLNSVDALECDLDGTQIPDPFDFRVGPGEPYSTTFPDNNVFEAFGCTNVTPGTYSPFVSGGYYIMLAPLRAGAHTLHFTGHTAFMGSDFTVDITYHIQVGAPPPGQTLQAAIAPNPMNPQAKLRFTTAKAGPVRVDLYDLAGRLVRTLYQAPFVPAGSHELVVDGRTSSGTAMASGVYYYRVRTSEGSFLGRFAIVR
jgi:hypothetical protein